MKTTKLSSIVGTVLAATASTVSLAGHYETKIDTHFSAMDNNGYQVITRMEYRTYFEEIESE